jgi:hypothetical protein
MDKRAENCAGVVESFAWLPSEMLVEVNWGEVEPALSGVCRRWQICGCFQGGAGRMVRAGGGG